MIGMLSMTGVRNERVKPGGRSIDYYGYYPPTRLRMRTELNVMSIMTRVCHKTLSHTWLLLTSFSLSFYASFASVPLLGIIVSIIPPVCRFVFFSSHIAAFSLVRVLQLKLRSLLVELLSGKLYAPIFYSISMTIITIQEFHQLSFNAIELLANNEFYSTCTSFEARVSAADFIVVQKYSRKNHTSPFCKIH